MTNHWILPAVGLQPNRAKTFECHDKELGMIEEARDPLGKNISLFESAGVTQVVTACPDWSFAFKEDCTRLFGNENRKFRFKVLNLGSPSGMVESLAFKAREDSVDLLPDLKTKKNQTVALHNPCYLSRQGIWLPNELSKKGFVPEEVIDSCCRAVGGVYFTNPGLARE